MSTIIVIMQFFYLKSPKKLFKDYNIPTHKKYLFNKWNYNEPIPDFTKILDNLSITYDFEKIDVDELRNKARLYNYMEVNIKLSDAKYKLLSIYGE